MKVKIRGLNITIIVQDETWRKLGTFKYNDKDKKRKRQVLKTLQDAYGIKFKLVEQDLEWV